MKTRCSFVAAVGVTTAISVLALGLGASAAHAAAFRPCPTQQQLEQRGATAAEVSTAPQTSTGTFSVAQGLNAPDEQCSYQGTLHLLLMFWRLAPSQKEVALKHFAYECKRKPCTVFLTKGVNTVVVSSPGGKTKTKSVPTLNEVVISGNVTGEAITEEVNATTQCDVLAAALYGWLVGGARPGANSSLRDELSCADIP
jgi:hypothetical protein